jgi:hypothetical protein
VFTFCKTKGKINNFKSLNPKIEKIMLKYYNIITKNVENIVILNKNYATWLKASHKEIKVDNVLFLLFFPLELETFL